MNTRIYKEYRILRPFWAVALLLPLVPLMVFPRWQWQVQAAYCAMGYVVGCLLLGAASFGAEWNHQTMDLLLSQPLSRQRIWRDKIRALALALGTLGLVYFLSLFAQFNADDTKHSLNVFVPFDLIEAKQMFEGFGVLYGLIWFVLPMVWALGAGPFFALRTGNSIAAFAFSVVTPFIWVVIMGLLLPSGSLTGQPFAQACCVFAVPLILFAGAGYGLARFRFHHLETAGIAGGAIRPIEWLSAFLKSPAVVAPPDTGGALSKLIRKELRLHEISLLITGCAVLICSVIMAYRPFYAAFSSEPFDHSLPSQLVVLVAVVAGLIIPMLVGAVSVAEERQMGLLEWHLTLPPSRFRQWLVKTLTAYGCSIVLGILTPTALVLVSEWLCPASLDRAFIRGPAFGYLGFCSISLLLTTVCLVASSLSQTSIRAILLSLGTIALAGVTIGVMRAYNVDEYLFESTILMLSVWSLKYWALDGLAAAAVLLMLGLSYANYRRVETELRPAIQTVLVGLALVFLVITPSIYTAFQINDREAKSSSLSGRALLAHLRHEDPQRVVAELGVQLNNPANAVAVMRTLRDNRYRIPEALPLLVAGLTNSNPEVQFWATMVPSYRWNDLQNQPSLFDRARVTLYQNLQNPNARLAHTTAMVLGRVDTATIIDALNRKPADSTTALAQGTPDNFGNLIREKFVPLLVEVYDKAENQGREAVIDILGKLGPGAKQAIPMLLKASQSDPSSRLRSRAIEALKKIDPEVVHSHNLEATTNAPGQK